MKTNLERANETIRRGRNLEHCRSAIDKDKQQMLKVKNRNDEVNKYILFEFFQLTFLVYIQENTCFGLHQYNYCPNIYGLPLSAILLLERSGEIVEVIHF